MEFLLILLVIYCLFLIVKGVILGRHFDTYGWTESQMRENLTNKSIREIFKNK